MSDAASEIVRLRAALAAETVRAQAAERELVQARALASCSEAMIKELKLEVAKLRRDKYGISSERRARLIDQLELQLEELEAAATEDALAEEKTAADADTSVRAFTRRKPVRKPFPEHLPRERVVKMGEDITETLEVIPRQWKVIQPLFAQDGAREVHLPRLREDQPGEEDQTIFQWKIAPTNGTVPRHSPWLGWATADRDGGI